jgi:hypothetical protein
MPAEENRQPILPVLMVIAGILLIVGAIAWIVLAGQKSAARQSDLPAPVSSPRIPYPAIKRVALEDAKAALDAQQAIFVDARGAPYYSEGHIPGATSMAEADMPTVLLKLDPNAWIITYCT